MQRHCKQHSASERSPYPVPWQSSILHSLDDIIHHGALQETASKQAAGNQQGTASKQAAGNQQAGLCKRELQSMIPSGCCERHRLKKVSLSMQLHMSSNPTDMVQSLNRIIHPGSPPAWCMPCRQTMHSQLPCSPARF